MTDDTVSQIYAQNIDSDSLFRSAVVAVFHGRCGTGSVLISRSSVWVAVLAVADDTVAIVSESLFSESRFDTWDLSIIVHVFFGVVLDETLEMALEM